EIAVAVGDRMTLHRPVDIGHGALLLLARRRRAGVSRRRVLGARSFVRLPPSFARNCVEFQVLGARRGKVAHEKGRRSALETPAPKRAEAYLILVSLNSTCLRA